VSQRLPILWCWIVRAYALACIAEIVAVWSFHSAFPHYDGIPWWLFIFVYLPALGLEIFPIIFLIEVSLVMKGIYRRQTFAVQTVLVAVAWCFCLQGLQQSPPLPPKSAITVEGKLGTTRRR